MVSASLFALSLATLALCAPSRLKSDLSDAWNIKACIFGATCFGGQHPVDGFLAAVYADRGFSGTAPTSVNLPRVTTSVFNSISTDGSTVRLQNFIDGYYSSLDPIGGPYPTSAQVAIQIFETLQDWTGFCDQAIPFQNFADYFQFSSSVVSHNCGIVTTTIFIPSLGPTLTSSIIATQSSGDFSSTTGLFSRTTGVLSSTTGFLTSANALSTAV